MPKLVLPHSLRIMPSGVKLLSATVAKQNKHNARGLIKQQTSPPLPIWELETQALRWLWQYVEIFQLKIYDPLTHGCQWDNDAFRVFTKRRHLFTQTRWYTDGPSVFKFWKQAGIAPREHAIFERGRRLEKVPHYKVPADAKLFVGDDPILTARALDARRGKPQAPRVHQSSIRPLSDC